MVQQNSSHLVALAHIFTSIHIEKGVNTWIVLQKWRIYVCGFVPKSLWQNFEPNCTSKEREVWVTRNAIYRVQLWNWNLYLAPGTLSSPGGVTHPFHHSRHNPLSSIQIKGKAFGCFWYLKSQLYQCLPMHCSGVLQRHTECRFKGTNLSMCRKVLCEKFCNIVLDLCTKIKLARPACGNCCIGT